MFLCLYCVVVYVCLFLVFVTCCRCFVEIHFKYMSVTLSAH